MKTKNTFRAALLATAALCAVQAQAADGGGYVLVAGGRSHFSEDCTGLSNCKVNGNAVKLAGGYRLGSGLAIEAMGMDFGKATGSALGVNVELKARAVGAGVAFHADIAPKWMASVRLGLASVKVKANGSSGGFSMSDSETSTKPYVGIGLGYAFTDTVSLQCGFDSTRGKYQGQNETISAWTVGIGARF
jgi:OOP family OmpA-OmpF porin